MTTQLPSEIIDMITHIYVSQRRKDTDYQELLQSVQEVGARTNVYYTIIDEEWYSLQQHCRYRQSRISVANFIHEHRRYPFHIPFHYYHNVPDIFEILNSTQETILILDNLPTSLQVLNCPGFFTN